MAHRLFLIPLKPLWKGGGVGQEPQKPSVKLLEDNLETTVTVVQVRVVEGKIQEFIEKTLENHRNSILEPGNLRFDVLQDPDDDHSFLLYEMYSTPDAAGDHKNTPHYLAWKEGVASLMAQPRKGMPYRVLAPLEG